MLNKKNNTQIFRGREKKNYLRYRPHFAFPFAASVGVIPLEQETKKNNCHYYNENPLGFSHNKMFLHLQ